MGSGDVYGLGLALEAAEGDEQALATARAELARLEGVARRFSAPGRGSVSVHFEETKGCWVAHEMRVDASGRLTIKTRVRMHSPIARESYLFSRVTCVLACETP